PFEVIRMSVGGEPARRGGHDVCLFWHEGQYDSMFSKSGLASPFAKIFVFLKNRKGDLARAVPPRHEGRDGQSSPDVRRDAMDVRCHETNDTRVRSSRVVLSPRRWGQVDRDDRSATVAKKPETPGRARSSRKDHRAGNAGVFRRTCGEYCSCTSFIRTRGYGCGRHPAFPAPSVFEGTRLSHSSG